MSDNYIPTGRYCYKIGRHYVCTDDDKLASVYFGLRLLEKMGGSFAKDLREVIADFQKWAKANNSLKRKLVKEVIEKMQEAEAVMNRNLNDDSIKGDTARYQEPYDMMVALVPLLEETEKDIRENPKGGLDTSPERLLEIKNEIVDYYASETEFWETIALLKEAYNLVKLYPESVEGCYSTPVEKALFLHFLLSNSYAMDAARLEIEIRTLISEIFEAASPEERQEHEETVKDNESKLRKRKKYIDLSIPMDDYCKEFDVNFKFDDFLRTEKWEAISYRIYQLAYESIPDIKSFHGNYTQIIDYFKMLVLNANNIEYKDEVLIDPSCNLCRFSLEVGGEEYFFDALELYSFYLNANNLMDKNSLWFDTAMEYMQKSLNVYVKKLEDNEDEYLTTGDEETLNGIKEKLQQARDTYKENPEDFDTPLEMCRECISDINSFEYYRRHRTKNQITRDILIDKASRMEYRDYDDDGVVTKEKTLIKEEVVSGLKRLCDQEEEFWYLYLDYALLKTCENWYTIVCIRPDDFRAEVATGVEKYGSLAPDRHFDWCIIQYFIKENPDEAPMEDMTVFHSLVSKTMEEGTDETREIAREIHNMVWPPENTIDED